MTMYVVHYTSNISQPEDNNICTSDELKQQ